MPVAYESDGPVSFPASNSNAAITVALPATRPLGSVLLMVVCSRLISDTIGTAPVGYTLLTGFPKSSGTASGGRIWVYARVVDGTESAPTVACSSAVTGNSGDLWCASLYCYSGVDTSGGIQGIVDGAATVQDASGTTTCTYPALTITNADSMLLRFLWRIRDAADTFTPTATWNEREDIGSTVRTGGQHHFQDKLATASGAQATVTVAPSNTTAARYLAITMALKAIRPPKTASVSDGFALTDACQPTRLPTFTTLIDDFNRADGPVYAGAGAAVWDSQVYGGTGTTPGVVSGNVLDNGGVMSAFGLASDFDLVVDVVATPTTSLGFQFCVRHVDAHSPLYDAGMSVGFDWGTQTWWPGYHVDGVGYALSSPIAGSPPVAGESFWFRKRGGVFQMYRRPTAGGPWTLFWQPNLGFSLVGPFVVGGPTAKLDNIRGGPLVKLRSVADGFALTDQATPVKAAAPIAYTRTPADSFGLTDTRTRAVGVKRTLADTFGLTDARTRTINWKRSRADTFGLTDSEREARGKRISDGFALTDATVRAKGKRATVSDTFGLTDAERETRGKKLADTFGLTDARTRAVAFKRTVADAFGLTDARKATHVVVRSDTFGLTDARTRTVAFKRACADSFGLTDSESEGRGKRIADGFGLTDARVVARATKRTVADGLALADSCSPALIAAPLTQSVSDSFALTDSGSISWTANRSTDEQFLLTDATSRTRQTKRTVSDGFALTDARKATHVVVRADGFALTDARARTVGYRRTRIETFGLTDARAVVRAIKRTRADGLALTDVRTLARAIKRTRVDTFGLTDAERETRGKRISDTLGLSDQRTRTIAWKRTRPETFALSDVCTPIKTSVGQHTRLVSDTFGLTDTRTRRVTWHRSRADSFALTDQIVRVRGHRRTRADTFGLTDQVARVRAIRRTRADGFAFTDLATPQLTLGSRHWTRTVADSIVFTDTRARVRAQRITDGFALTDARTRRLPGSEPNRMRLRSRTRVWRRSSGNEVWPTRSRSRTRSSSSE